MGLVYFLIIILFCFNCYSQGYSNFNVIIDRNIFSNTKQQAKTNAEVKKELHYIFIDGVLKSDKGNFVFFDSSKLGHSGVLKLNDYIQEFKISQINDKNIVLTFSNTSFTIEIGDGIIWEDGEWNNFTNSFLEESKKIDYKSRLKGKRK